MHPLYVRAEFLAFQTFVQNVAQGHAKNAWLMDLIPFARSVTNADEHPKGVHINDSMGDRDVYEHLADISVTRANERTRFLDDG